MIYYGAPQILHDEARKTRWLGGLEAIPCHLEHLSAEQLEIKAAVVRTRRSTAAGTDSWHVAELEASPPLQAYEYPAEVMMQAASERRMPGQLMQSWMARVPPRLQSSDQLQSCQSDGELTLQHDWP